MPREHGHSVHSLRVQRSQTEARRSESAWGRAWRFDLLPLTTQELGEYRLDRILNHGLIPSHYTQDLPERSLRSYVLDYIEQGVHVEAITRNVPAFAKFLEAVAQGEKPASH